MKPTKRWFSDVIDYSPVEKRDEDDAERLARKIETELAEMPLWCRFVVKADTADLRFAVNRIINEQSTSCEAAETRLIMARQYVSWRSRKRPGPGEEHYDRLVKECSNEGHRLEQAERLGRLALADLEKGQAVSARSLFASHRLARESG